MNVTKRVSPESGIVPGYRCEVSWRGPNWLFVRVDAEGSCCGLGERLWRLAEQEFTYRLVLDFGDSQPDQHRIAPELQVLCSRLSERGGALRLCGLDPHVARVVLDEAHCPALHNHTSTYDAVWHGPLAEGGDGVEDPPAHPR